MRELSCLLAALLALVPAPAAPAGAEGTRVRTVVLRERRARRELTYPGTVLPYQKADLAGRVAGYLAEVAVFEGDVVDGDRVLARISVPDLEAEKASAAVARAERGQAEAARRIAAAALREKEAAAKVCQAELGLKEAVVARYRELVKARAVTAEQLEDAEAEAAVARARGETAAAAVEHARASLDDAAAAIEVARQHVAAREAAVRRIETLLRFAEIRSPYPSALVSRRHLDAGALVEAGGGPILTVMDVSRVRVLVHVPERDVPAVKAGQRVAVLPFADRGRPVEATLTRTAGALDPSTRTMRAEVEIESPGAALLPGMLCTVRVTVVPERPALFLPAGAVLRGGGKGGAGKASVFVVENGKARRVEIETGVDDGVEVEVVSGLEAGAVVILEARGIEDGEAVSTEGGS